MRRGHPTSAGYSGLAILARMERGYFDSVTELGLARSA